ncbi:MAG TPA: hypothetical protein VNZ64_27025 [Candidatus Acidoferrum sp.]|jgi:hypothetical protein|nr:hypothetical protein [Candidatus Acidoferrum sp.]
MDESESLEPGLIYTLEQGPVGLPPVPAEAEWAALVPPGWRGRLRALGADALRAFWAEAIGYARFEIGQYGRWREQDDPVLADGYDAEGLVQAAFERLMYRETGSVPILYTAEDIRRELRALIKHRVRWLHERSETRLVTGEWDVLPPKADGELVSIFDHLPGRIAPPDEELMRKEKEKLLGELKGGFEASLGKRKQLLEVFGRVWDGQKRREVAQGLGAAVERVKALQAQVGRRLARFGAKARGGVAEMLEGVKEGS